VASPTLSIAEAIRRHRVGAEKQTIRGHSAGAAAIDGGGRRREKDTKSLAAPRAPLRRRAFEKGEDGGTDGHRSGFGECLEEGGKEEKKKKKKGERERIKKTGLLKK